MMRLKYTDGSLITDHLNAFQCIINQLAGMGIKFEDEIQGLWLMGFFFTFRCLGHRKRGEGQSRGPSNKGNHRSSSSKGKFADVECYHCHKKGHTMKFYRQLKKENKKKNYNNQKNKHKKDDDGDDNTEVNTTTDEFFVCYDYDMVNLANDDSSWILNSGATSHFDTGMELVLHNVKHVPDMRLNIISTGLLDEDGYHNSSGNGLWKVTLGSLIVARGKRESKLYMTHPKISKSIVNAVDNDDMTELFFLRRMCYLVMENILDLVHSDVCGPIKTKTLGGCSYVVTFIDDYSRKHQKTLPKTPQLNGLVERMNITLVERVRCLLSHAGLPASFWGEALNTSASVHIPKYERSKLDVKEHGADDVDAQEQPNLDEDVHPELPVPMPPFVPLRRSTRDHHPSTRYSANEYVLLTNEGEPECYTEAIEDKHKKEWFDAMQDEMKSLPRYKARLVVKGFSQKRGIDFDEIFSPVMKMGSIRVVLGLAASLDLEVDKMDVKTAFFHGEGRLHV
ncbi:putative RNA-directed DNA polymerase [Tanacetum coccineum]